MLKTFQSNTTIIFWIFFWILCFCYFCPKLLFLELFVVKVHVLLTSILNILNHDSSSVNNKCIKELIIDLIWEISLANWNINPKFQSLTVNMSAVTSDSVILIKVDYCTTNKFARLISFQWAGKYATRGRTVVLKTNASETWKRPILRNLMR